MAGTWGQVCPCEADNKAVLYCMCVCMWGHNHGDGGQGQGRSQCRLRAQSLGSWAPRQLFWLCDLGRVPWSLSASFHPSPSGQEALVTIAMSLARL